MFKKIIFKPEEKVKVKLYKFIKFCPCRTHAWFESNVGKIRKPIYHYVNIGK